MSQQENFRWKVAEYRALPFERKVTDPNTGQQVTQTEHCFYVRGVLSTGNAALDLQARANRSNSDMHIVLFFNSIADQEMALKMFEDGSFNQIFAKHVDVPVEPYNRIWTRDSGDGRSRRGDMIIDGITGNPIEYNTLRVSVLCDPQGNPQEDPFVKARNNMKMGIRDGSIQYSSSVQQPVMSADDAAMQAGITIPSGSSIPPAGTQFQQQPQQQRQQQQQQQFPQQPQQQVRS